MDTHELQVRNSSLTTKIFVRFNPPEDANTPTPPTTYIFPEESDLFTVKNGTMNLFVWTDISQEPIWKGIIPTKIKEPVLIFPEQKKVFCGDIEIPDGFGVSTDPGFVNKPGAKWAYLLCGLFLVILIFLGIWLYYY